MLIITEEYLDRYQSLFRGRSDIYARRWEKDSHSGYSPAYDLNWDEFNKFKSEGGLFKDFKNKKPIPLSRDILKKHLLGQLTVGVYPILTDNTSYFITADFDGTHWQQECKALINECQKVCLQSHLERSRSGNGGHVWIFFEEPYPCYKSRQMILELIRRALQLSEFDKEVSFDRLFPNQDAISKEGLGNLIALPLQGQVAKMGNSLFLDKEYFEPYPDQWKYLETIHRYTIVEMETAYSAILNNPTTHSYATSSSSLITVVLNNKLALNRSELTAPVINFLKEKLNFINTEYLVKRRLGKSVYKVEKYFKLIEEEGNHIFLPRAFLSQLISFFCNNRILYEVIDQRPQLEEIIFADNIKLLPTQRPIIEKAIQSEGGVIIAPSGSGKTIIGLEIVAQRKLPALILVHRKQLLDQWIERIQAFLEISSKDIGQYYSVKKKRGEKITVAMLQTLSRIGDLIELKNKFGTIIVDECHHIPAQTFREVISQLNPKYCYGLTATPKRKHNDEQLIYLFLGDIIAEMEQGQETPEGILKSKPLRMKVFIRETKLEVPFKFTTDNFQLLTKLICFDTARNQMIIKDVAEQTSQGKKVLLLSERRDHLEILNLYFKGLCETIIISGEDSNAKRITKFKQIQTGHYQVILSTGQFFGEGLDINNIDCLVLAFPFSFEGKLIQYIGRLRGKEDYKIIIDYNDKKIPFLERQFRQRQRYYKKNGMLAENENLEDSNSLFADNARRM